MLSLRVLDAETGNALSAGQAVGRDLAYFVSTLPRCPGFIWIAFDRCPPAGTRRHRVQADTVRAGPVIFPNRRIGATQ
ncbi:MAG: hypothetical protein ACRES9_05795 [Gammaproteobacteria bacterium]